jgi:serine protease Do
VQNEDANVVIEGGDVEFEDGDITMDVENPVAVIADDVQEEHGADSDVVYSFMHSDDQGWLGVSVGEVTPEKVKEFKLAAERGALVTNVEADSPAARAGLKSGDVIMELAGQRIEGAAQFRRLVRETPAGRTVALTVWREGRAQTFSATLSPRKLNGHSAGHFSWPDGEMNMVLPPMPAMPAMPPIPSMGEIFAPGTPRLGIDAEDLSGELGKYFGAPDGEGVLVRDVRSGSPAERGGLKAGDVIIKVAGERVKSSSDLRARLRASLPTGRESKTVNVIILRKGTEMTLPVALEPVTPPADRHTARRIAV